MNRSMFRPVSRLGALALLAATTAATPVATAAAQETGAKQQTRVASNPDISFERDQHDFGSMTDEAPITTNFKFTNTGGSPLEILDVKSSCGCTVPQLAKTIYAPGETGSIEVTFDPKNKAGFQNRRITLTTNIPGKQFAIVSVLANVSPLISITPKLGNFGQIRRGEQATVLMDVTARYPEFEVVEIAPARASMPLEVEVVDTIEFDLPDGTKGRKATFMITATAEGPIGRVAGGITFSYTGRDGKTAVKNMSIAGEITGDLQFQPRFLAFGAVAEGGLFSRNVQLMSADNIEFDILGIVERPRQMAGQTAAAPRQLRDIAFSTTPIKTAQGKFRGYTITIQGGIMDGVTNVGTDLVFRTNHPEEKEMVLRTSGRQGGAPNRQIIRPNPNAGVPAATRPRPSQTRDGG